MKKIVFLTLVLVCSCCPTEDCKIREVDLTSSAEQIPFDEITKYEYNGHKYIKFEEAHGASRVGGVVHDPDCECYKSK